MSRPQVVGYEEFDAIIATVATIEAYLILLPAIYEVSRILVPGVPEHLAKFYTDPALELPDPKQTYCGLFRVVRSSASLRRTCGWPLWRPSGLISSR